MDSDDDTILYMYYGNPDCGNQENPVGVWDPNFVMVQHLEELSSIHYDSTSNNNDGSPSVTVQGSASGMVDGADEFDGSNDYINCGNDNSLDITDAITIEAWIYHQSGGSSYARINDKYPAPSIYIKESTDELAWYGQIGGSSRDFRFTSTNIPVNSWSYIAVTYANDVEHAIRAYVNWQLQEGITSYSGVLSATTTDLVLGNRMDLGRPLDGFLDEVRISSVGRSSGWISTCYSNQYDPYSKYVL